jgi:hypothetical protein
MAYPYHYLRLDLDVMRSVQHDKKLPQPLAAQMEAKPKGRRKS